VGEYNLLLVLRDGELAVVLAPRIGNELDPRSGTFLQTLFFDKTLLRGGPLGHKARIHLENIGKAAPALVSGLPSIIFFV
jgi:hypothetical protein